jgi:tuberous sclerosis 2
LPVAGQDTNFNYQETLISLLNDKFYDEHNVKDILRRDPVSGLAWDPSADFPQPENEIILPNMLAPLINPYPGHTIQQLQQFPDFKQIKSTLQLIDLCPVIDAHKAAVIYVAPGQKTEEEILSNRHGSPAYERFIKDLGRLLKLRDELEVYTAGLNAKDHGQYALGWWDDASQIVFHVATFMPNKEGIIYKKQEIGNDAVKIVWNDGGSPYKFGTIPSEYNLINIIIEPHTLVPQAAYEDDPHVTGFYKVIMQTRPGIPKVTPIGDFKIIQAENLPGLVRLNSILAALFCNAWVETGMDEGDPQKLITSWQRRLELIRKTEKYLPKEESAVSPTNP